MTGKSDHLTHVNASGEVHMVDVGAKEVTQRVAFASAFVACSHEAVRLLRSGELKKGDALAVARIAAIASVKKTPDLIPLCHPIAITGVAVTVTVEDNGVLISTRVKTADRTGIEMEALTAATTGALNIVDMIKAVDRGAHISYARIDHKSGGRSGEWTRNESGDMRQSQLDEAHQPDCTDRTGAGTQLDQPHHAGETSQAQEPRQELVGVITVSDRSFRKEREDQTGPMIATHAANWGMSVTNVVVPDEIDAIQTATRQLIAQGAWLVVTTGGTGISSRDVTPEAVSPLMTQQLPALTHALQSSGVGKAPGALLSRSVAGVHRTGHSRTAIITLPGSVSAVRDGLDLIDQIKDHLMHQLHDGDHDPHAE